VLWAKSVSYFAGRSRTLVLSTLSLLTPVCSSLHLLKVTEDDYDQIFHLNARGTCFTLQQAAHHVTDGGRIISISTFGTRSPFPGGAAHLGAAGEQFVRHFAMELGPRGITVNTLSPRQEGRGDDLNSPHSRIGGHGAEVKNERGPINRPRRTGRT